MAGACGVTACGCRWQDGSEEEVVCRCWGWRGGGTGMTGPPMLRCRGPKIDDDVREREGHARALSSAQRCLLASPRSLGPFTAPPAKEEHQHMTARRLSSPLLRHHLLVCHCYQCCHCWLAIMPVTNGIVATATSLATLHTPVMREKVLRLWVPAGRWQHRCNGDASNGMGLGGHKCAVLHFLLRIPHLPPAVFSWVLQAVAHRGGI